MLLANYEPDNPDSLSKEEALAVSDYRRRATFRALCVQFLGFESQRDGRDLARDAACRILGLTLDELLEKIGRAHV